ncbi:MAG: hypothetical protein LLG20_00395 [Acidobacteriales bacterium]|nr:hypothetical protein [Terriglobales bacterium]
MQEKRPAGLLIDQRGAIRGLRMAILITGDKLLSAVNEQTFIKNGEPRCAEGVKYDLRMGSQLLKAGNNPVNTRELPENERAQLCLDPGEMAFVLTEETLDLPEDMIAVLSPKRTLSHDGILVLGGFLIDPLYRGNLLVGLYNFSSTRWPLRPDKKLIAVVFYKLAENEFAHFTKPDAITEFPDPLVRVMRNYTPTTLGGLRELIQKTQKDVATLREEFRSQEDWKRIFRESLDRHDAQIIQLLSGIEKLSKNLEDERINRLARDAQVTAELGQVNKRGDRRHNFWLVVLGVVLAWLVATIWPHISKLIESLQKQASP